MQGTLLTIVHLVLVVPIAWAVVALAYRIGTDIWGAHRATQSTALEGDRGRVQFTDVILALAMLVSFVAIAPWVYNAIGMATGVVDPLSGTLLSLSLPAFVVAMILSLGVSARSS